MELIYADDSDVNPYDPMAIMTWGRPTETGGGDYFDAPIHSYLVEVATCPNVTSCTIKVDTLKKPEGGPNERFEYPIKYNLTAPLLQQGYPYFLRVTPSNKFYSAFDPPIHPFTFVPITLENAVVDFPEVQVSVAVVDEYTIHVWEGGVRVPWTNFHISGFPELRSISELSTILSMGEWTLIPPSISITDDSTVRKGTTVRIVPPHPSQFYPSCGDCKMKVAFTSINPAFAHGLFQPREAVFYIQYFSYASASARTIAPSQVTSCNLSLSPFPTICSDNAVVALTIA
jgi:hypothetical protein